MKKLSAIVLAVLMVLTLSVSVFAEEAEPAVTYAERDVMLCFGNSVDWQTKYSEVQNISESGEYTFKIEGLDYAAANLTVIYVKESAVESGQTTEGAFPEGTEIITKSFKLNGEEITLTEGYPLTLNSGIFDVCWYNIWATSYISLDGIFDINSVEVTLQVNLPEESAEAPAEDEPAVEEPAVDVPAVDEPAVEEPTVDEEEPAETGLALAVIPAAVAMAVIAFNKKR